MVILATAVVLLISVASIYWIGLTALKSNARLARQREVIGHIERLGSTLKDAETGQRGYLLTGEARYLEPYNQALEVIKGELAQLARLAADGELPGAEVSEVNRLSNEKLAELEQTVKLQREGNTEGALAIVRSNRGKELMDTLRSKLAAMEAGEAAEFNAANREAAQATGQRNWAFLGTGLLNLCVLAWAYGLIARQMRQQQVAQALLAKQARLIDLAPAATIVRRLDGTITFWSDGAEKLYGWTRQEALGRRTHDLLRTEFPDDAQKIMAELQRGGRWSGELRQRTKDGRAVIVESHWLGQPASDGAAVELLESNMDITGRKRTEEELRRLKEELEQRVELRTADLAAANKELEAFGYSVSHDLRAPLRHVSSFIKLLEQGAGSSLTDSSRRHVRIIAEAAQRMGHLIDDLLVLSRIGRATMTESNVSLRHLVDDARKELAPEMAGRVIEWHVGPLPQVRGDATLLRSAVVNLLSNALKYTRQRNPARIEVGSQKRDGEVVCFVKDNGAGFDMKFVDKLFGVFQRLHDRDQFEGTGIGLASVRRIFQRHGGRTWAEGAVNQGATFYFTIPAERIAGVQSEDWRVQNAGSAGRREEGAKGNADEDAKLQTETRKAA